MCQPAKNSVLQLPGEEEGVRQLSLYQLEKGLYVLLQSNCGKFLHNGHRINQLLLLFLEEVIQLPLLVRGL